MQCMQSTHEQERGRHEMNVDVGASEFTWRVADASRQAVWSDLPMDVREVLRHCILDWFAVTLRGSTEPIARLLYADALTDETAGACSIVGQGQRLTMLQAALINGAASHALDYDDVHLNVGHPTVAILPAVLALAEQRGSSGRSVADAYFAGYDAACRIGEAIGREHYDAGFHTTATIGTLGAAVACAHLLTLPREGVCRAIGIAATQAAGLKAMFGTMCKPFHAGRAARDGLHAARLAAAGMTASLSILDGPIGFMATLRGRQPESDRVIDTSIVNLRANLFKYHAACYLTHAAIDCALRLRADPVFDARAIERISITAGETISTVCNISVPENGLQLKFSIAGVVAMALEGMDTAAPETYSTRTAEAVARLPYRQHIHVELVRDWPATSVQVELVLKSGGTLRQTADSSRPATDLDEQRVKLIRKFHALASNRLTEPARQAFVDALFGAEELPNARSLFALVSGTFDSAP
ncbi:MmgE/PrpD family protein [Burkholderia sp. D-99]|uniref:MmgE/PrpD family protein n=1 Tax=Burkholderia sp. D-99 TaxID=2717316 RepID=UPI00141E33D6|nr:MmgE/PrpD family protein [Burkholderia sp. D-99]NHV25892.1 MmgE/PrpD family protein [Burkholderia sp. D-99]